MPDIMEARPVHIVADAAILLISFDVSRSLHPFIKQINPTTIAMPPKTYNVLDIVGKVLLVLVTFSSAHCALVAFDSIIIEFEIFSCKYTHLSHTPYKSPIKNMLRKLFTPNIQRIESICAISTMLQQVLL